jgi:hypothetical protein
MARSVLADGRPIRRSQLKELKRQGAKISGSHHDVIGRPRQQVIHARLQKRFALMRTQSQNSNS